MPKSSTDSLIKFFGLSKKKSLGKNPVANKTVTTSTDIVSTDEINRMKLFSQAMNPGAQLVDLLKASSAAETHENKIADQLGKTTAEINAIKLERETLQKLSHQFEQMIRDLIKQKNPAIEINDYNFLTSRDADGTIKCFLTKKSPLLEGGEAIIKFGSLIDEKTGKLSDEIVIRTLKLRPELDTEEYKKIIDKEIKPNKVLYSKTSNSLIFPDGTMGYFMEKLPGVDFVKKWAHEYNSILIYKPENHEDKEPNVSDMKSDQIILSKDFIYWLEDGRKVSFPINDKFLNFYNNYHEEVELKTDALKESNPRSNNQKLSESEEIRTATQVRNTISMIQKYANCRPGRGFDCREFREMNLTFLQRCEVMRDCFEQLARFHEAGYSHGDINPTNFKINLVEIDGVYHAQAKLFDFGQSNHFDKPNENSYPLEQTLGMIEFVAPDSVACDISLMAAPPESNNKLKISNLANLFLYKNESGDIFYQTQTGMFYIKDENILNKLNHPFNNKKFENEKICQDILDITSERGHTHTSSTRIHGKQTDMYNMAGVLGMVFTDDPNAFISDRLTTGDELQKSREKDNSLKAVITSTKSYNFENMFSGLDDVDLSQKKQVLEFTQNLTDSDPAKRATSKEAYKFFDNIVSIQLDKQKDASNDDKFTNKTRDRSSGYRL